MVRIWRALGPKRLERPESPNPSEPFHAQNSARIPEQAHLETTHKAQGSIECWGVETPAQHNGLSTGETP